MRFCLALLLLAPFVACGDQGADVDFSGDDLGEDRFAIDSESGGVRMGLTDEFVYFALSDSVLAEARSEMDRDTGDADGVSGAIGGMVRGAVGRALSFRAKYAVADIRDIRWADGRMVMDFTDPDRSLSDSFEVDDRPVAEAFAESDVQAFAAEFRKLKRERGEG